MDDWHDDYAEYGTEHDHVEHDAAYTSDDSDRAEQYPEKSSQMVSWIKEIVQLILIVVVVRVGMDTVIPRYIVDGASMQPNFHTSERVIVDRVSMLFGGPSRGDVVVLESPAVENELLIKRVIGLPGDQVVVKDHQVLVNGKVLVEPYISAPPDYEGSWDVPEENLFVLGDNRNPSADSRVWGYVPFENVIGKAIAVYWPINRIRALSTPDIFAPNG